MGSITKANRVQKATGKTITVYRAYVRREGFASKSKVCANLREAKEWLRNNDAQSSLHKTGKTLAKLVEDFTQAPPTAGTKFWNMPHLDFWVEQLGSIKVPEISRGDINGAVATLRTRKVRRNTPTGIFTTDKPLSAASVNRYLASLSSVLNFAMDHGIIDTHPMKGGKVKKLKEGPGRTRILTVEEEARLMDAARESEWPALPLLIRMCLTTAGRKSEVLKLRWADVRLDESIAVLSTTKNGRARALPLVSDVCDALREAEKVKPLHSDLVFFDPRNPTQPMPIDVVWRKCRLDAGLLTLGKSSLLGG